MLLVVAIIVLALILGGVGLLVEGLKWVLIIALAVLVVGVIVGVVNRRKIH